MSRSEIQQYLNDLGRYPVLSKETQLLHCYRIHEWVSHPKGRDECPAKLQRIGKRSLDIMVQTNLRLVVSVARGYQNRGLDLADLIQEGNMGLIRGLEGYDPTRGYAITTYIYWWIRQAITRALHLHGRTIRIPINTHEIVNRAQKATAEFQAEHRRSPTLRELSELIDESEERLSFCLQTAEITRCLSYDMRCDADGGQAAFLEFIPAVEEEISTEYPDDLYEIASPEALEYAFSQLAPRERQIIEQYFYDEMMVKDIANGLSVSRSRIGQLRKDALTRMRLHIVRYNSGLIDKTTQVCKNPLD